jgi:hypothetical protein
MENKCKNLICNEPIKSDNILQIRLQCPNCGTIFIKDGLELSRVRIFWREYPECFYNFDSSDDICKNDCNVAKRCKKCSPPTDKDYYSCDSFPDTLEGLDQKKTCPNCGFIDSGLFCSRCGEELFPSKTARPVGLQIIRLFFEGWPEYLNTVKRSLFYPQDFFSGAFSKHSKSYHYKSKTLPPARFLLLNTAIIGLVTTFLNWIIFGKFKSINFPVDLLNIVINVGLMYVPAFFLNIFLNQQTLLWRKRRKKSLIPIGEINFENTIHCFIYSTPIEILQTPFILLATKMIINDDFQLKLIIGAAVLAFIGKMLSMFILLPNALQYCCRIPPEIARAAVTLLYLIPALLTMSFRMFSR